jgi:hypothetical protein
MKMLQKNQPKKEFEELNGKQKAWLSFWSVVTYKTFQATKHKRSLLIFRFV